MRMRICGLFDQYRDRELAERERREFESHLARCEDCATKMTRLDNLVAALPAAGDAPLDLSRQIARKAFEARRMSWDSLVVSWMRPGAAFTVLALVVALVSFLWLASGFLQPAGYSEYEKLMEEADNAGAVISDIHSEGEMVLWLEEEGHSQ